MAFWWRERERGKVSEERDTHTHPFRTVSIEGRLRTYPFTSSYVQKAKSKKDKEIKTFKTFFLSRTSSKNRLDSWLGNQMNNISM